MTMTEHDLRIMALTIAGEARGESFDGKVAVGHVILNRLDRPGWWSRNRDEIPDDTIAAVCADPLQFSCWNRDDPNLRYLAFLPPDHPVYLECLTAALSALRTRENDPTAGSCHYYDKRSPEPFWARGKTPVCTIGHHAFFNDID